MQYSNKVENNIQISSNLYNQALFQSLNSKTLPTSGILSPQKGLISLDEGIPLINKSWSRNYSWLCLMPAHFSYITKQINGKSFLIFFSVKVGAEELKKMLREGSSVHLVLVNVCLILQEMIGYKISQVVFRDTQRLPDSGSQTSYKQLWFPYN